MLSKGLLRFSPLLLLICITQISWAHPMGNFSVNHYSKITLERDRIQLRYFIDLAEIPTYQELQKANLSPVAIDPNSATVIRYIVDRGVELGKGLHLEIAGINAPLQLVSSGVIFPAGAGGLPTMKMGFVYEASYPAMLTTRESEQLNLYYSDNNFPGQSGWKEMVALSSFGSITKSSVPTTDRSGELSNYPTDLLTSPPQTLEVSLTATLPLLPVDSASAAATRIPTSSAETKILKSHNNFSVASATPSHATIQQVLSTAPASQNATALTADMNLQANRQQTPRSRFTDLIQSKDLSLWFLFTAALIAMGLGGLHALEPGHGKTIVAAYLVGSKGTLRHAALLGLIVTLSHTAGVFALGAITLYASRYIVPEQLYPWLGALSGLIIAGLGCYMLMRRLSGTTTDHSHAPGSSQAHWTFWKRTSESELEPDSKPIDTSSTKSITLAQLFTLGITGGIIPCPAALIVLLSAFALHRIAFGFFLIVAFSLGLAAVLIFFGMLMVSARSFMTRLKIDGPLTKRWLPVLSSSFIMALGVGVTIQGLSTVHVSAPLFSKEALGPVLFVTLLGLILGMRHSTDADHVVAISTIVSKQRSVRSAAFIGSVWGLGHTITIFIVGALIILFGVEIPPRLGLSMEFNVALMLILLGILNLTGVMRKITDYFTPAATLSGNATSHVPIKSRKSKLEKWLESSVGRFGLYQFLRPLIIGLVHGLAGSAAVALLVLSTIHNPIWATGYLLIFGAGTMIGMMCMTILIAVPLSFAGERSAKLSRYLSTVSGLVSLCFGSFLVYQLGFLAGLFTSHPHWIPS